MMKRYPDFNFETRLFWAWNVIVSLLKQLKSWWCSNFQKQPHFNLKIMMFWFWNPDVISMLKFWCCLIIEILMSFQCQNNVFSTLMWFSCFFNSYICTLKSHSPFSRHFLIRSCWPLFSEISQSYWPPPFFISFIGSDFVTLFSAPAANFWVGTPHHPHKNITLFLAICDNFPVSLVLTWAYPASTPRRRLRYQSTPDVLVRRARVGQSVRWTLQIYLESSALGPSSTSSDLKQMQIVLKYVYMILARFGWFKRRPIV